MNKLFLFVFLGLLIISCRTEEVVVKEPIAAKTGTM